MSPMSRGRCLTQDERGHWRAAAAMRPLGHNQGLPRRPRSSNGHQKSGPERRRRHGGLAAARSLVDAGAGAPDRSPDNRGASIQPRLGRPIEMGESWIHGTANDPLMELAPQGTGQVFRRYYGWASSRWIAATAK